MTESWRQKLYRGIPKMDEFLSGPDISRALLSSPRWAVLDSAREVLEGRREAIARLSSPGEDIFSGEDVLHREFFSLLSRRASPSLRPLINATGIIVHTNLGRSPLPVPALEQIALAAGGYSNLEYHLQAGERGSRQAHLEDLLCRLTGAEAAVAVNNNAAAVLLCLNSLAANREVIVSRGQLVEIGGSFRIPEVMQRSGAVLREVGTTNKTRLEDYREAIGPETALLLKVHASNYRVFGFTETVEISRLALLGREHALPVMEDLGSGSLVDLSRFGLRDEPTVQSAVKSGADIVTFSGDKLLGGPQAGLIVGRRELVEKTRLNPLHRALRMDKLSLAALEATLRLYLEGEKGWKKIPTLRMISETRDVVRRRARRALRRISPEGRRRLRIAVVETTAYVGGGATPLEELPSAALAMGGPEAPAHHLEELLRKLPTPVIGRVHEGLLLLDLRTVSDPEVPVLASAVQTVAEACPT